MPVPRRVIISVVSDLVTDQRVHRTALALHSKGLIVTLVGRRLRSSLSMPSRPYQTKRFNLGIETGPLFYAFYNIRLFFFLLFSKADILVTNDLDTLLPNFIISDLKNRSFFTTVMSTLLKSLSWFHDHESKKSGSPSKSSFFRN